MKTILFLSLIFLGACSKEVQKPALTIGEYSQQVVKIHEVINKLMNEKDIKTMNYMASGLEETRAIPCDAVGDECNAYYELINKMVKLTADGDLTDVERMELVKMKDDLNEKIKKSELDIQQQWKDYINGQKK